MRIYKYVIKQITNTKLFLLSFFTNIADVPTLPLLVTSCYGYTTAPEAFLSVHISYLFAPILVQ